MDADQEERKFLHDVANPVATAVYVLDGVAEEVGEMSDSDQKKFLAEQIALIAESLEKVTKLISDRREILIQRSGK